MSSGYGKLIYRKRKRSPFLFVMIAVLVLVFCYLIFKSSGEKDKNPEIRPGEIEIKTETNDTPFQNQPADQPVEPLGETLENHEIKDETTAPHEPAAIPGTKKPSNTQLEQIKQYLLREDYRNALSLLKVLSKTDNTAYTYIGLCYYKLEEFKNAHDHLKKALEHNGNDFVARKFMAFTCYKTDDLENSILHTDKALEIKYDKELYALQTKLLREERVMEEDYIDRSKSNFKVFFSRGEHSDIKDTVLGILKEAYHTIGKEIDFFPPNPVSIILYNEKGFFDVTRSPSWAGGLYDGKIRLPIKGAEEQKELLRRVLFHEYTHALIHAITPKCPLWINEGLAMFFENHNYPIIGQIFPLDQLEKRFPAGNARKIAIAYLESYSAVSYLIDRYKMHSLKELLEALGEGENFKKTFEKIYYMTYERFLQTWGKKE